MPALFAITIAAFVEKSPNSRLRGVSSFASKYTTYVYGRWIYTGEEEKEPEKPTETEKPQETEKPTEIEKRLLRGPFLLGF